MTTQQLKDGWLLFKEALAGNDDIDYTQGSIARATFLLAVPMILEMAMESLFAIVDIFFVARLGTDAVATVGLTESVITLLYALAIGLSMGTTAMVARRIGEKDPAGASLATGQALWMGIFVSVAVGTIGLFFARDILSLMGAEESVLETGVSYTRLMLGGCFTIVFLFLINAIFRGAGDATRAMRALWLANGINIVLDPCFIFGIGPFPEMGVTGAAVATNIGRGVGVLYGLYYLCDIYDVGSRIRLHWRDMKLHLAVVAALFRISIGGVAQFLVATASWVFLMRIVSEYGGDAVAGYTIAIRVVMFTILPAWGLSNAAATLVGQNLGAAMPDRAEKTVWQIAKYNSYFMAVVTALLLIFAKDIVAVFTDQAVVIAYGVQCLRIFSLGFIFLGVNMAVVQAFNGAGDTLTPTWINILCFWLVQVPLAYSLAMVFELGPVGVFWAVFTADALAGIVGVLVFRRGRWKLRVV